MSARLCLVVVALAAVPLAGCVGSGGAGGPGAPGAPDSSGAANRSASTLAVPAATEHVHDRWDGTSSTVLFDGETSTGSVTDLDPTKSLIENFVALFGASVAEFRPSGDTIVPPGTDRVEVTASWSEDNADPAVTTDVYLAYRAANMTQFTLIGSPRDPDATWTIDTGVEMADGGHAVTSLWDFRFFVLTRAGSDDVEEVDLFRAGNDEMTFDVEATAYRVNGSLPKEPSHPDWWGNGTERPVASASDTVNTVGVGTYYVHANASEGSFSSGTLYEFVTGDEHQPVPPGTEVLVAHVNWTNGSPTSTASGVRPFLLYYHGDGFLFKDWAVDRMGDGTAVFTLPVKANMTDGMYTKARSRWSFYLGFTGAQDTGVDDPGTGEDVTSPYRFDGSYTVSVRAYNTTDLPGDLPAP